jgi:flagellin-like hook-associated protein FlgL
MALTVSFNAASQIANRQLATNDMALTGSVARLSAGSRVLSAKDDAAALAVGSRINSTVQALRQAGVNAGQAASMVQIADGAMAKVNDILDRMKSLAVQSSSGQLSNVERGMINTEYVALRDEIDRISGATEFNGQTLIGYTGATYTLRGNVQHGAVKLIGVALGLGDSFTQTDIDLGRVTYENDGGGSATDRLIVSVSDQDGNALGTIAGAGSAAGFEDAEYRASGGLGIINASTAYARAAAYGTNAAGSGITVAVIDTGVDTSHSQLAANLLAGTDIADGDSNPDDDNAAEGGHGTHVSGIIAAVDDGIGTQGVAFQAKILPVKVVTTAGNGGIDANDVAAAINYAVAQGAKIINMSLGGSMPSAAENAAIDAAVAAGVVVIAASGNSALADPAWPAQYAIDPNADGAMLAVGATDYLNHMASFSNRAGVAAAATVDAPGVDILSTYVGNTLAILSGTSMASPLVAGAAAVLESLFPNLSGNEITNLLTSTARDMGQAGADKTWGQGIIDLARASLPQIQIDIGIGSGGDLTVTNGGKGLVASNLLDPTSVYSSIDAPTDRSYSIKVASDTGASDRIAVSLEAISSYNLGLHLTSADSLDHADSTIDALDLAKDRLVTARAGLGASLNRLDFAAANIATTVENSEAARSALLDLDMASEMMVMTSRQVLVQMGVSMSAQANIQQQSLLKLLQ